MSSPGIAKPAPFSVLLRRELDRLGRGVWIFWARAAMVFVGGGLLVSTLDVGGRYLTPGQLQQAMRAAFESLTFLVMAYLAVVSHLAAAASLQADRQAGHMDLLGLAGYRPHHIAVAKWLALTIVLLVSTLAAAPLLSISLLVGDVDPLELLSLAARLLSRALWGVGIGLLAGAIAQRLGGALLLMVLLAGGFAMLGQACLIAIRVGAIAPHSPTVPWWAHFPDPMLIADALAGSPWLPAVLALAIGGPLAVAAGMSYALALAAGGQIEHAKSTGTSRAKRLERWWLKRVELRDDRAGAGNPIVWRDSAVAGFAGNRRGAWFLGAVLLLQAGLSFVGLVGQDELWYVLPMILACSGLAVGYVLVFLDSVRAFKSDRRLRALEVLVITTLPAHRLVVGKLTTTTVVAAFAALPWLLHCTLWSLGGIDAWGIRIEPATVLLSSVALILTWPVMGYLGAAASLAFRNDLLSTGLPVIAVLVSFAPAFTGHPELSPFMSSLMPFVTAVGDEMTKGFETVMTNCILLLGLLMLLHPLTTQVLLPRAVARPHD